MVTSTTTAVWIGIPAGGFAYSPWSDRNDLSCNVNGNGYTSADYFGVMWNSGEIKTSPHTDSGNNLARDIYVDGNANFSFIFFDSGGL